VTGGPYQVVNVRGWPGLGSYQAPRVPAADVPRLGERNDLVLVAAGAAGKTPERFGLGAFYEIAGPSVVCAGIIVADDASSDQVQAVRAWAQANPIDGLGGPVPWSVLTLSEFYDPRSGPFVRRAYSGAGWCIGADLGRVFGLAAEHYGARMGRNGDSFEVWLPGWGKEHERGCWKRISPHRPSLRLTSRRVGWHIAFGPCERGQGKYHKGTLWRGAFLDVLTVAYALDADRGASFSEHCASLGLTASDLPVTVTIDGDGAAQMAAAVDAVHRFMLTIYGRTDP
jgi:hypothetical protein